MRHRVRQVLRCPACEGLLTETTGGKDEKKPDGFHCSKCDRAFPVKEEVPRMLLAPAEYTPAAQSFGFQWKTRERGGFEADTLYGLTEEEEHAALVNAYGVRADDFQGKLFLDVGCGDGASLELVGRDGAEVVGMDINTSITVSHRRCKVLENVTVLQVDMFHPCFAPASFDFVWCEGVVVATSEPFKAFQSICRLVKPGGQLYLWVYPSERPSIYQSIRDLLVAPYILPRPILYRLSYCLALCLLPLFRLTGRKRTLRTAAFDLFDNLSPRYQWRYTENEIRKWFTDAGFVDLRVTGRIGMSGRLARG